MARINVFIILLFLSCLKIEAQYSLFLELNGNSSILPTLHKSDHVASPLPPGTGYYSSYVYGERRTESFNPGLAGSISGGIKIELTNRFSFESGVEMSLLNYQRIKKFELVDNTKILNGNLGSSVGIIGQQFPIISVQNIQRDSTGRIILTDSATHISATHIAIPGMPNLGKTSIVYLSFPINLNYMFLDKRLSLGFGFSPTFIIYSSQVIREPSSYPSKELTDRTSKGMRLLGIAANLNIRYHLKGNIWLTAAFQQFLSPIYSKSESFAGNAKCRLIKAGLRYYFH